MGIRGCRCKLRSAVLIALCALIVCAVPARCQQVSTAPAYVSYDVFSGLMRGVPKTVVKQLYLIYIGSATSLAPIMVSTSSGAAVAANSVSTGSLSDPSFIAGDIYAFPNPAKGKNPTIHIEVGVPDSIEIRIYDAAGSLKHSVMLPGPPAIIDRGTGPKYAYEHVWDVSGIGSDVYVYIVHAKKQGSSDIVVRKKIAIIK